jgi:hypothetical protein
MPLANGRLGATITVEAAESSPALLATHAGFT